MNDERIIASIKAGDEAAIDHVITKYSKLLWFIAGSVLKHAATTQDIEECVADVFIYLWQHPERYDPKRGRLKVWLSVIARTRAIDRYRTLSKQSAAPLDDPLLVEQMGLLDGIIAEDDRRALIASVRALEEPDREILVRRYYYDQKPKEIAVALDMPVKQVENHLYRTKQKLRSAVTA